MRLIGLAVVLVLSLVLPGHAQEAQRQTFGEWTAHCQVDTMTDAKKCLILSKPVAFGFRDARLEIVLIGTKHTGADRIRTRYRKMPGRFVDSEISTSGFSAALAYVRWRRPHRKRHHNDRPTLPAPLGRTRLRRVFAALVRPRGASLRRIVL